MTHLKMSSDSENEVTLFENKGEEVQGEICTVNDLLLWSLSHSSGEKKEYTKKDKEFVKKAMGNLFTDRISMLEDLISKLNKEETTEDEVQDAMNYLVQYVADLNGAIIFGELKGFDALYKYLTDKDEETRRGAAMIIVSAAQNNPKVQMMFNNSPGMKVALDSLRSEDNAKVLNIKISMISCLIRGCKPNRTDFYKENGLQFLIDLNNKTPKNWSNFAFTISSILDEEDKEDVEEMNKVGLKEKLLEHKQYIDEDDMEDIMEYL